MKKLILCALMAFTAIGASAQFEAGKTYISASTTGLGLSYSKDTKIRLDIDATAGYFVERDWMVYGRLGYAHRNHFDQFSAGLGGRYYIEQNGLYLNLGALFEHSEPNHNNLFLTPEVGYTFFVNHYLTIEPALYYDLSVNDFSDSSRVGLRLGLGYFF